MELVRTERLLLRRWDESDLAAFLDIYSREDVARWLGPHPRRPLATAQEAQERLRSWRAHESGLSRPLGLWAIVPCAAGAPAGQPVGTLLLLLPLSDDGGPTGLVEVGWHLDNTASQRVAMRLGMQDEGVTGRWFGLTARQYRKVISLPEP
jgi:RimJ/RimL family protein N-acetyltransferase